MIFRTNRQPISPVLSFASKNVASHALEWCEVWQCKFYPIFQGRTVWVVWFWYSFGRVFSPKKYVYKHFLRNIFFFFYFWDL